MTTDDRSIQISDLANALRQVMDPTLKERLSLQERPPGAPHVRIPCVSPTGATFDAVVASSKAFPHFGRVRGLENYKYPETFFFGDRDGIGNAVPSKVIDGKTREFNGKRQDLTPPQRMALTKATWNRDLATYVGKEFDVTIRLDLQPRIAEIRKQLEAEMAAKTEEMTAALESPVAPVSAATEAAITEASGQTTPRKTK